MEILRCTHSTRITLATLTPLVRAVSMTKRNASLNHYAQPIINLTASTSGSHVFSIHLVSGCDPTMGGQFQQSRARQFSDCRSLSLETEAKLARSCMSTTS